MWLCQSPSFVKDASYAHGLCPLNQMTRILALPALLLCPFLCVKGETTNFPTKPIKVIVPFGAGGGSDTFVRLVQKAVDEEKLLPHPLVVQNIKGAGGTIGSRKAKDAAPDGYTILCLHEGILTAKYAGKAEYGPEAFEPIAGTGDIGILVAVKEDSPFKTLSDLMDVVAGRPDEIVFATNLGAPSHYVGLMLEDSKEGALFRHTQTGGGADRFAALVGGHCEITVFSLSEFNQFKDSGIRALALCAEQRHPAWPDMPTAREQGFDVIRGNTHFWWAPKGTSKEHIQVVSKALRKAMQSPAVRERLKAMHTDPTFLEGPALQDSLARREAGIAKVSKRETESLPDFPMLSLYAVIVLAAWAGAEALKKGKTLPPPQGGIPNNYSPQPLLAVQCVTGTAIYILVMQSGWIGFQYGTVVYILAVGLLLSKVKWQWIALFGGSALSMGFAMNISSRMHTDPSPWRWLPVCVALPLGLMLMDIDKKRLAILAWAAFTMGFGLHYTFAKVFNIELP